MKPYLKLIPIVLALLGAGSAAVYGSDVVAPIVAAVCGAPALAPASDAPDGGAQ